MANIWDAYRIVSERIQAQIKKCAQESKEWKLLNETGDELVKALKNEQYEAALKILKKKSPIW